MMRSIISLMRATLRRHITGACFGLNLYESTVFRPAVVGAQPAVPQVFQPLSSFCGLILILYLFLVCPEDAIDLEV